MDQKLIPPNFKNVESLNENIEKKNDENLQSSININQKEKTESKKSENYQLKNTVDSQNKKVEFDKVTEKLHNLVLILITRYLEINVFNNVNAIINKYYASCSSLSQIKENNHAEKLY